MIQLTILKVVSGWRFYLVVKVRRGNSKSILRNKETTYIKKNRTGGKWKYLWAKPVFDNIVLVLYWNSKNCLTTETFS